MSKFKLLTAAMVLAMTGTVAQAQTSTTDQVPTSLSPGSSPGTELVGVPGCHFGETVDNSTADDVQRILTDAGYTSISSLNKGCDNNWHGRAMLNGIMTNVMITPEGRIVQEGS